MVLLTIFDLDSANEPITTLKIGEHIIGRGELLKCDDQRVSRNHCVIKVTENAATITSVCKKLTLGLFEQQSFRKTHENPCFYQNANSSTITILPKENAVDINDGDKFALLPSKYWFTIKMDNNSTEDTSDAKANSFLHVENNNCGLVTIGLNEMDKEIINKKRALEVETDIFNEKKPKYSEGVQDEVLTSQNCIAGELEKVKELVSDSEDDTTPAVKQTEENTCDPSVEEVQNNHDELKEMAVSDENTALISNTIQNSENDESNCGSAKPDVPSTSTSKTKQWRDHCWYGLSCYRKNESHLAEYSHPGDSDYETDPEDNRPMCSFGTACYRRNTDHRQSYKHSRKPQKPSDKRPNKKNNTIQNGNKKRTTTRNNDESSEDDYDLDDPFIASGTEYEASTDDDDDSSSTDSDENEQSEEDTRRLLKEAKRFTKGKR